MALGQVSSPRFSIRYMCHCEQKQRTGNGSDVIFLLVALKCCHAGTIGAIPYVNQCCTLYPKPPKYNLHCLFNTTVAMHMHICSKSFAVYHQSIKLFDFCYKFFSDFHLPSSPLLHCMIHYTYYNYCMGIHRQQTTMCSHKTRQLGKCIQMCLLSHTA